MQRKRSPSTGSRRVSPRILKKYPVTRGDDCQHTGPQRTIKRFAPEFRRLTAMPGIPGACVMAAAVHWSKQ